MKMKLVVVDLELTRRQKRMAAIGLALAATLTAGGALADVPNTFEAGQTLKAADLNENFTALEARAAAAEDAAQDALERVATLEAAPEYLVETASDGQTGEYAEDVVYEAMEVTLQPGTWLVEATATLSTTSQSDAVQLGLWNHTTGAEVAASRGAAATSEALEGGYFCGAQPCSVVPTSASAVLTVTTPTTIRVKGYRNGSSTLTVGRPIDAVVLAPLNRISALRLR